MNNEIKRKENHPSMKFLIVGWIERGGACFSSCHRYMYYIAIELKYFHIVLR